MIKQLKSKLNFHILKDDYDEEDDLSQVFIFFYL